MKLRENHRCFDMNGRNDNQAPEPTPPPLPVQGEIDDSRETVPVSSAWQLASEEFFKEDEIEEEEKKQEPLASPRQTVAQSKSISTSKDEPPAEDKIAKELASAVTAVQGPRVGERRVLRQVIVGLTVAVVVLFAMVLLLLVFVINQTNQHSVSQQEETQPEPEKSKQAAIEAEVTSTPAVIVANPLDADREEYKRAAARVQKMIFELAGHPSDKKLETDRFQNLDKLVQQISPQDSPVSGSTVFPSLAQLIPRSSSERASYDVLWRVGLAAYRSTSKEMDSLETLAKRIGDASAKRQQKRYQRWIAAWLLGKRGVYCQVRERFWEQVRAGEISVEGNGRKQISKLRQERRKYSDALHYPNKPLYDYCERSF